MQESGAKHNRPLIAAGTTLAALCTLSACASDGSEYPSLSIREAERITGAFEPVEPTPYVPQPPREEVLGSLDRLQAEAQAAHERFLAAADDARRPVAAARGAEMGSESWSVAQVALARLESSRSDAMIALADLDRLYIDAALDALQTERIERTRGDVAALVESQDAVINSLYAEIAQ